MARIYNKINLPTNTTDIQMFAKYLKAINEKGIVSKEEEQQLFANVKISESRKNVTAPKRDTHTKQTLSLFGLITINDDGAFSVSNLGKEVIKYYASPDQHTEEERVALMLKVFMRWEVDDDQFNRHMHPGYLTVKLLCDPDLHYYFTNQEFADFVMNEKFVSDGQYDEIKKALLDFRKGVGISKYVAQSKAGTFLATLVSNWNILTADGVTLTAPQAKQGDKYFKEYTAGESSIDDDVEDSSDDQVQEANTDNGELSGTEKNANAAFHTIKKYSLIGIASYIAHLFLYLQEGIEIKDYCHYFSSDLGSSAFKEVNNALQQIIYGAPGTGKSHAIKNGTKGKDVIRTTFHPDTDYSTFVGAYKPTTKEVPVYSTFGEKVVVAKDAEGKPIVEDKIIYEFVEQAFLQAYINAWKKYAEVAENETPKEQYLIIEEINRGNCAQIFGDLFQLLDRNDAGFSDYPIKADNDMSKHLKKAFDGLEVKVKESINHLYSKEYEDVVAEVLTGRLLLLPNNLYIWATMNTSDQSLFPIDSAFKRRWEWKYIPIRKGVDDYGATLGWKIVAASKEYDWWEFLKNINGVIGDTTSSEDKKLGYFFVKANASGEISADKFVGKVAFYLWNDVFKDYGFDNEIFKNGDSSTISFQDFFLEDGKANEMVVGKFLANVEQLSKVSDDDGNKSEDNTDSETQ